MGWESITCCRNQPQGQHTPGLVWSKVQLQVSQNRVTAAAACHTHVRMVLGFQESGCREWKGKNKAEGSVGETDAKAQKYGSAKADWYAEAHHLAHTFYWDKERVFTVCYGICKCHCKGLEDTALQNLCFLDFKQKTSSKDLSSCKHEELRVTWGMSF